MIRLTPLKRGKLIFFLMSVCYVIVHLEVFVCYLQGSSSVHHVVPICFYCLKNLSTSEVHVSFLCS